MKAAPCDVRGVQVDADGIICVNKRGEEPCGRLCARAGSVDQHGSVSEFRNHSNGCTLSYGYKKKRPLKKWKSPSLV